MASNESIIMAQDQRTFVIGDIHGRAYALAQVLDRAKFRKDIDKLITLGDICDGGRQSRQCYEILLKVKNRIDVIGNHDLWFYDWLLGGAELPVWTHQGGYNTLYSYDYNRKNVPLSHRDLIKNSLTYYIDEKNRIYVHGGFHPKVPIERQDRDFIVWDRSLIKYAKEGHKITPYAHVFVGHTTTQIIQNGYTVPLTFGNLTMMDCGGGWNGKLAMMNVDNLSEYYVSDTQNPQMFDESEYLATEEDAW
jgi:serine/threonine protein phosphatase 1